MTLSPSSARVGAAPAMSCPVGLRACVPCVLHSTRRFAVFRPHSRSLARKLDGPCAVASAADLATSRPDGLSHSPRDIGEFTEKDLQGFLAGYRSQYEERAFWIAPESVEGTIPEELEGTLLRNGPGLFEVGGVSLPQPFDGDGMVCTYAFKGGQVFFRNRYVRTKAFLAEQEAGRMLHRGAFSVGSPSGRGFFNPFDFSVKGVANTGVLAWGGKVLALYERDLPYEMDAELRTKGQTNLRGSIDADKQFFGAHYRIIEAKSGERRLVAFNFAESPLGADLTMFEYDNSFGLLHKSKRLIQGAVFGFFHDLAVTEHYYVFLENPIIMNYQKLLFGYSLGRNCLAECLEFDASRRTKVHLIRRPGCGAGRDHVFETEPFFSFHHANAFEAGDKRRVVVDTVAMRSGFDFSASFDSISTAYYNRTAGRGTLTRLVLDTLTGQVAVHAVTPERAVELPSVAPSAVGRPFHHSYLVGARQTGSQWGAPQAVVKVTMDPSLGVRTPFTPDAAAKDVYLPPRGSFAQEPIFVPRCSGGAEDDGWVLTVVYCSATDTTDLVILDAQHLARGPLATIHLPHHIPHGLHGCFTCTYLGPDRREAGFQERYNIKQGVSQCGVPKYSAT